MSDPTVLILFLATWGGIALLFRRLTDDFRKATVRQSEQAPGSGVAPAIDEELLRITSEVQETVEGLGDALTKRAEHLRTLIAEADKRIVALESRPARLDEPVAGAPPVAAPREPVVEREPRPVPETLLEREAPPVGRGAEEVHRLAAEGLDVDTIARLTKRGREEVRLLLRRAS